MSNKTKTMEQAQPSALVADENASSDTLASADKGKFPHVIAFTSGKGGVGKTCVTTNVATALAQKGARVCIFDADTGLANINILLGLRPEFTLEHVLNGEKSVKDVVIKTRQNVAVIPGATGIAELASPDQDTVTRLCDALTELEADYDYFLIDTAAGVADSVLHFIESAAYTFLLITPEPTSLTDGFSLLKLLNNRHYLGRIRVIVNMADDYPHATETYRRFATAVDKYLELRVDYGGFVARDDSLKQSIMRQTPVVELFGTSPASRCLQALADNMLKHIGNTDSKTGLTDYWKNVLQDMAAETTDTQRPSQQNMEAEPAPIAGKADFAILAERLLTALHAPDLTRQTVEAFTGDMIAGFQARFGNFPDNFQPLLYRWLETGNYPSAQMQELASTLELLYMAKHGQPLHNLENSAARLIGQCKDSEAQMRNLANQFRSAYFYAFQSDVFDARKELLAGIQKESFSEDDFQRLLSDLGQAFQTRFKRPYRSKSDLLLATANEKLESIAEEENTLAQQLAAAAERLETLQQQRASLLDTLKPK